MPGPWRRAMLVTGHRCYGMFQSQARCQAPGDCMTCNSQAQSAVGFNLKRDARPLATQSILRMAVACICFNLKRDARPLATDDIASAMSCRMTVSISSEMPGPWRRSRLVLASSDHADVSISSEMPGPWRRIVRVARHQVHDVSISSEMPGPWRRLVALQCVIEYRSFQSQARCQAPGDMHGCLSLPACSCFNLKRDARPLAT